MLPTVPDVWTPIVPEKLYHFTYIDPFGGLQSSQPKASLLKVVQEAKAFIAQYKQGATISVVK